MTNADIYDRNVGDLISRQAAIDEATRLFEMGDCYCDRASIVGMLNSLPSAQRCENCEHSSEAPLPNRDRWCNTLEIYCTSDWFCANWERRRR